MKTVIIKNAQNESFEYDKTIQYETNLIELFQRYSEFDKHTEPSCYLANGEWELITEMNKIFNVAFNDLSQFDYDNAYYKTESYIDIANQYLQNGFIKFNVGYKKRERTKTSIFTYYRVYECCLYNNTLYLKHVNVKS